MKNEINQTWYMVWTGTPASIMKVKVSLESPECVWVGGVRYSKECANRTFYKDIELAYARFKDAADRQQQIAVANMGHARLLVKEASDEY